MPETTPIAHFGCNRMLSQPGLVASHSVANIFIGGIAGGLNVLLTGSLAFSLGWHFGHVRRTGVGRQGRGGCDWRARGMGHMPCLRRSCVPRPALAASVRSARLLVRRPMPAAFALSHAGLGLLSPKKKKKQSPHVRTQVEHLHGQCVGTEHVRHPHIRHLHLRRTPPGQGACRINDAGGTFQFKAFLQYPVLEPTS